MIELVDTLPDINIDNAEYARLLGYPRGHLLSGRARELSQGAREWYAQNGRPAVYARMADTLEIADKTFRIDGTEFSSPWLRKTFHQAEAHSTFLVLVTAGPELEAESQRLWLQEKPDEYFFLEIFGSAVVEHLRATVGARLCAWADGRHLAVLPHYSPGYTEWDIAEQPRLWDLIKKTRRTPIPAELEVLDSGMLKPKKSLLAVFGVTRHIDRVRRITDLIPCENCSITGCQYRRVPYKRAGETSTEGVTLNILKEEIAPQPAAAGLKQQATYTVNAKALARWAEERLTLEPLANGETRAFFKYEGTTCSNMGRALHFHYTVKLGPKEQGYPLREMLCEPAPGDEGHQFMCRYMSNPEHLMVAIDQEKPLLGKPLDEVLSWQRPKTGAGCYCEPNSRKHKWGLVLETLHFALAQRNLPHPANEKSGIGVPPMLQSKAGRADRQ